MVHEMSSAAWVSGRLWRSYWPSPHETCRVGHVPSWIASQSTRRIVAPQHDLPSSNIDGCIPPLFPPGRIQTLVARPAAPPPRVSPRNSMPISRVHRSSLRAALTPMAPMAAIAAIVAIAHTAMHGTVDKRQDNSFRVMRLTPRFLCHSLLPVSEEIPGASRTQL